MSKWNLATRIYNCKCGLSFIHKEDFIEHLRDTKRWKKYHYAPDQVNNGRGFIGFLVFGRAAKEKYTKCQD